jgi:hypothetical protein
MVTLRLPAPRLHQITGTDSEGQTHLKQHPLVALAVQILNFQHRLSQTITLTTATELYSSCLPSRIKCAIIYKFCGAGAVHSTPALEPF